MHYPAFGLKSLVASLLTVLIFASFSHPVQAQDKAKLIDELASKYSKAGMFNGSILAAEKGKVIYEKGFGYANSEWKIFNTPETKFRVGSITKQFTAMLIMQLVEKGKLKLNDKITDFLPYYRKDTGDKITIIHLLNHTSGIPSYTSLPALNSVYKKTVSPDDFIKEFCSGELEFEPGKEFRYNNSGYFILGAIIEKVAGMSYEDALKKNILGPLAMDNTGYDHPETILEGRASGYAKTLSGFKNADYIDMSIPYAAGAMYSTVRDMYKWEMALYTDKLLGAELKKEIFTPGLNNYGFGWFITKKKFKDNGQTINLINHGGSINGFLASKYRMPDEKNFVVVLSNLPDRSVDEIANGIIDILYGRKPQAAPEKSFAQKLYAVISKEGIDKALLAFDEMKKDTGNKNIEAEMNSLGYGLLAEKEYDAAEKIFKKNIEAFPDSYNTYDSMGEFYVKTDRKDEAIKYYRRSVELNPQSVSGKAALNQLGLKTDDAKTGEIKLAPEILAKYAGNYRFPQGFYIAITAEGGRIFEQLTGQAKYEIYPYSETEFFMKIVDAKFSFRMDEKGKAVKLILTQNGSSLTGERAE